MSNENKTIIKCSVCRSIEVDGVIIPPNGYEPSILLNNTVSDTILSGNCARQLPGLNNLEHQDWIPGYLGQFPREFCYKN